MLGSPGPTQTRPPLPLASRYRVDADSLSTIRFYQVEPSNVLCIKKMPPKPPVTRTLSHEM